MLFLHDLLADLHCPHFQTVFAVNKAKGQAAKAQFPIGKASAAAAFLLLAGGAFWIGSNRADLSAEVVDVQLSDSNSSLAPDADVAPTETDQAGDKNVAAEAAAAEIADVTSANPTDVGPQISEPPELFVGFNETPSVDASQAIPDAPALPELTLPSIVSLPDLPDTAEPGVGVPKLPESVADVTPEVVEPEPSLLIVKADKFPQDSTDDVPGLPDVLPKPVIANRK